MRTALDLKSKFVGAMVGCGVGDAVGELAFSYGTISALRDAVARGETLIYTDDTAMAMGLAESLAVRDEVDPQHLGETFRANYEREPWRGYAMGPPSIFQRVAREGVSYTEAAGELFGGEGSYGNGAAMRVAPVGLFFHTADDLYAQVRRSASVTHAHPLGVDGAALVAGAVARAVDLPPDAPFAREAFIDGLLAFARTDTFRARLADVREALERETPAEVVGRRLGSGVAAHRSVPFALYAFLRHPDDFEACFYCAALHSGDRDTVGAMAAQVGERCCHQGAGALPVDAILLSDDWGDQRGVIMGPELWRKFIKPRAQQYFAAVHAHEKWTFQHCCGSIFEIIPEVIEIGLDVLESLQPEAMDVYEIKRRYGRDLRLWGGLGTQQLLPFGTPAEIRAEVARLREELGAGGGYILAPAKPLMPEVPTENAVAAVEAFTGGACG